MRFDVADGHLMTVRCVRASTETRNRVMRWCESRHGTWDRYYRPGGLATAELISSVLAESHRVFRFSNHRRIRSSQSD